MHQTKKYNEWHFGMKLHIGVDETLGLIHSLTTTAANEHDITQADQILHGKEKWVWGDACYCVLRNEQRIQIERLNGTLPCALVSAQLLKGSAKAKAEKEKAKAKAKASVRAKVEHAFFYIKRMFGYNKVRYRGLEKYTNRLYLLAGFTNLLRAERHRVTYQG